jgi:hypothetical protein
MTYARPNPFMTISFCVLLSTLMGACGGSGGDATPATLTADSLDTTLSSTEKFDPSIEKFETGSDLDVQGQVHERENAQALDASNLELRARRYLANWEASNTPSDAASASPVVVASAASAPTSTSLPPNVVSAPDGAVPVGPFMRDALSTLRVSDCAASSEKDFIEKTPRELSRLMPGNCRKVQDNPVNFAWPQTKDRSTAQPWVLRVLDKSGKAVVTQNTVSPRLVLDAPLPSGR